MAKQDDWIRITLRLPGDLHLKLVEAAANSSMNAEIVSRLEATFETAKGPDELWKALFELRAEIQELRKLRETAARRENSET